MLVDGIIGPVTWDALANPPAGIPAPPAPSGLRKAVLDFAIAEASKGRSHNPGNEIDTLVLDPLRPILKELKHLGSKQNDSFYNWCAAWVTYVTRHAGIATPDRYKDYWASIAKVDAWRDMAVKTGSWIRREDAAPLPGDIVVYDWDRDTTTDHIGIVKSHSPASGSIMACEGNHKNRETIRERTAGSIAGYIDLEKLAAALGPLTRSAPKRSRRKPATQKEIHRKETGGKESHLTPPAGRTIRLPVPKPTTEPRHAHHEHTPTRSTPPSPRRTPPPSARKSTRPRR